MGIMMFSLKPNFVFRKKKEDTIHAFILKTDKQQGIWEMKFSVAVVGVIVLHVCDHAEAQQSCILQLLE